MWFLCLEYNFDIYTLTFDEQKITACWNPKNLPPKQLDTMFRCIEAIYKLNKRFSNVSTLNDHSLDYFL